MKQPTSVLWLIHSLEVIVFGAIFTFVITLYQAFQSNNLNLATVGVAASALLVSILTNGLKGIINNANFAQAMHDLFNELVQRNPPAAQPPVVINNHPPAAVAVPVEPTVQTSPQVAQQPFPVTQTYPMPVAPKS